MISIQEADFYSNKNLTEEDFYYKELVHTLLKTPDVTLKYGDVRIASHTAIWKAQSTVFTAKEQFDTHNKFKRKRDDKDMQIWEMTFDCNIEEFKKFVDIVHIQKVDINLREILTVMRIAHIMDMKKVMKKIVSLFDILHIDIPYIFYQKNPNNLKKFWSFYRVMVEHDMSYIVEFYQLFDELLKKIYETFWLSVSSHERVPSMIQFRSEISDQVSHGLFVPFLFWNVKTNDSCLIDQLYFDDDHNEVLMDLEFVKHTFIDTKLLALDDVIALSGKINDLQYTHFSHFFDENLLYTIKIAFALVQEYHIIYPEILFLACNWLTTAFVTRFPKMHNEIFAEARAFAKYVLEEIIDKQNNHDFVKVDLDNFEKTYKEAIALNYDLCDMIGYAPNVENVPGPPYLTGNCLRQERGGSANNDFLQRPMTVKVQIALQQVNRCIESGCVISEEIKKIIANYVNTGIILHEIIELLGHAEKKNLHDGRALTKQRILRGWLSILKHKNNQAEIKQAMKYLKKSFVNDVYILQLIDRIENSDHF